MTMIFDATISDHLVLIRHVTGFCLRLGFDMLDKVIEKLVAVSPGSVTAKRNISFTFYGWITQLITPGQATAITPVVLRQPKAVAWFDCRAMEPSLVLSFGLSSRRNLKGCDGN